MPENVQEHTPKSGELYKIKKILNLLSIHKHIFTRNLCMDWHIFQNICKNSEGDMQETNVRVMLHGAAELLARTIWH